ncbi:MAG: DUF4367 domain-containing protein [Tissierellaceae bacterium]
MDKYIINDDFLYKYMKGAENIILESLPKEEELSYKFSKRFKRKMNKLIRRENRTPFMKSFINHSKKVAVLFLIFATIAFATTMSVEAYRVKFFEVVIEVWEEFTSMIFKNNKNINDRKLIPAVPEYTPKGFSILEENINDYVYSIIYVNENNEEIFYEQRIISQGEVLLDTENIEVETIEVDNQAIILFTNKGVNQIYWSDDSYSFTLISTINIEELITITKNIFKNK